MKIFLVNPADKANVAEKTKAEYEIVKNLNIKGVMKYYEFNADATWINRKGEEKQVCYLVMELIQGVELL